MDLREGFRRLGVAASAIYWIGALALIYFAASDAGRAYSSDPLEIMIGPQCYAVQAPEPYRGYATGVAQRFDASVGSAPWGIIIPLANGETHLIRHCRPIPAPTFWWRAAWREGTRVAGWSVGAYLILVAAFRGLRWIASGFVPGGA